jgi:hypothetical protein
VSAISQPSWRALASATRLDAARTAWLVLGALVVVRLLLSAYMIHRPGLEYDETLFVNAATLRIPHNFLMSSWHGIPLMVFQYIGALKSWLYTPVFAMFGTSAATIRLPAVVIVCAGLLVLYPAVRDLVNRPVAILSVVALCFDNSIFWLTRDDVGPSAIELFLKCAALFCIARFARARGLRWLLLLLAALVLGVFNKLNFIWTVNAAAAASVIVAIRFRESLQANWRLAAAWVAGLFVIYAGFGLYYFGNHIGSLVPGPPGSVIQPWSLFRTGTLAILAGTWFYDYIYGQLATPTVLIVIVVGLFTAGTVASIAMRRTRSFAVAVIAVATLLIEIQIVFTVQATAGWHYISIYPFATIVMAYGVYAIARLLLERQRSVYIAIVCVGACLLAYDGLQMAKYLRALAVREPVYPWTDAIYKLSDDLQRSSHATILTTDWGISNDLFALHPSRHYVELAFALAPAAPTDASMVQLRSAVAAIHGPKLFVTHAAGKLAYPYSTANLFKAIGPHLHLAETVPGLDGKPVFQVYSYR